MATDKNTIQIGNWNRGGLSDSKWSGTQDSFFKMVGLDMHSSPGVLKVAQKMAKDSASTVTEFCKERVASSNGYTYWGSADSGKIWERTSAGVWSLVHTIVAAAGEVKILGMAEYQGYIYIATQSRLHRILATGALGAAQWTANIALNWATFTNTDISFHPMKEVNLVLYIGDAHFVAQVDGNTFSANAVDIKTPLRVKALGRFGTDLLIGTYSGTVIAKSEIFRWNTWSVSFTNSDEIEEVGINAFLEADNYVFVQAGLSGNIYVYDGSVLELYRKIPGDYSPTKTGLVHPSSVANYNGEILFGFSNGTGNAADEGVYRIARGSRNYPSILDFPYPISERLEGAFVTSGIEIGAILVVGSDLFVAWKNDTAYGIDKLDWSTKLDNAYLETRVLPFNRELLQNISKISVAYNSLPVSTAVNISYSKNYTAYTNTTEITDVDRLSIYADMEGIELSTLQIKLIMTTSSNTAPEIESGEIKLR